MAFHDQETLGGIHIVPNWKYADAAARTAADPNLLVTDEGKFAWQLDDDSIWMLIDFAVPTWKAVNGGAGTVTANSGSLTLNSIVIGNAGVDEKVVAGLTTDGISRLQLGEAGVSVGAVELSNATSGTASIQPPTGALGTAVHTLPAASGTLFSSITVIDALLAGLRGVDAGSTDDYVITLAPAITSYVTGQAYIFKANTANTGAATLNVNGLGAKTIVKVAGGITTALADNDILAGQWVIVVYDGTNLQMISLLGNASSGGGGGANFLDVQIFS